MKITCDNCGAVYRIPEEKLTKDVSRATCKKCGAKLIIRRPTGEEGYEDARLGGGAAEDDNVINHEERTVIAQVPELQRFDAVPPLSLQRVDLLGLLGSASPQDEPRRIGRSAPVDLFARDNRRNDDPDSEAHGIRGWLARVGRFWLAAVRPVFSRLPGPAGRWFQHVSDVRRSGRETIPTVPRVVGSPRPVAAPAPPATAPMVKPPEPLSEERDVTRVIPSPVLTGSQRPTPAPPPPPPPRRGSNDELEALLGFGQEAESEKTVVVRAPDRTHLGGGDDVDSEETLIGPIPDIEYTNFSEQVIEIDRLAFLITLTPVTGRTFFITKDTTLFGRDSSRVDIQIMNPQISGRHFVIKRQSAGYTITDLESPNGTFVNERRLLSSFALKRGDIISLQPKYRFVFVPMKSVGQASLVSLVELRHELCRLVPDLDRIDMFLRDVGIPLQQVEGASVEQRWDSALNLIRRRNDSEMLLRLLNRAKLDGLTSTVLESALGRLNGVDVSQDRLVSSSRDGTAYRPGGTLFSARGNDMEIQLEEDLLDEAHPEGADRDRHIAAPVPGRHRQHREVQAALGARPPRARMPQVSVLWFVAVLSLTVGANVFSAWWFAGSGRTRVEPVALMPALSSGGDLRSAPGASAMKLAPHLEAAPAGSPEGGRVASEGGDGPKTDSAPAGTPVAATPGSIDPPRRADTGVETSRAGIGDQSSGAGTGEQPSGRSRDGEPTSLAARTYRGNQRVSAAREREITEDYLKEKWPATPEETLRRADQFYGLGNLVPAYEAYRKVLGFPVVGRSTRILALGGLAMTARGLERMEEACDALKSMLRIDPGNPFAQRHLAEWETALTARRRP